LLSSAIKIESQSMSVGSTLYGVTSYETLLRYEGLLVNGGHGEDSPGGGGGFCVVIFQQLKQSTNVQGTNEGNNLLLCNPNIIRFNL
jgi:hypothetical protein